MTTDIDTKRDFILRLHDAGTGIETASHSALVSAPLGKNLKNEFGRVTGLAYKSCPDSVGFHFGSTSEILSALGLARDRIDRIVASIADGMRRRSKPSSMFAAAAGLMAARDGGSDHWAWETVFHLAYNGIVDELSRDMGWHPFGGGPTAAAGPGYDRKKYGWLVEYVSSNASAKLTEILAHAVRTDQPGARNICTYSLQLSAAGFTKFKGRWVPASVLAEAGERPGTDDGGEGSDIGTSEPVRLDGEPSPVPRARRRIRLPQGYTAGSLRSEAKKCADAMQIIRLLAVAELYDGAPVKEVSKRHGCVDSTVRTWVGRLRRQGVAGLAARKQPGRIPALSDADWHRVLRQIDRHQVVATEGSRRWRVRDSVRWIEEEFNVRMTESWVGRKLRQLGRGRSKPVRRAHRGTRTPSRRS